MDQQKLDKFLTTWKKMKARNYFAKARYGRDPETGLALTKDGKPRKSGTGRKKSE
jgi:hypothetical protein